MASYPLPSWLQTKPSDAAETFISAYHAGASVNMAKARLQQEQQQAQMELQAKKEIAQQNNLRQQQQLEIEKARAQAEMGLKQQALDQADQKIKLTAASAARKYAAQEKYKQLISTGMNPDEAALKIGPEAFGSMAGMAGLSKEVYQRQHPFVPSETTVGGQKLIQTSPNRFEKASVPPSVGPVQAQDVLDPQTGQPIPGVFAAPGASGAMGVHNKPKVVTPDEAELKRLEKAQEKDTTGQALSAMDPKDIPNKARKDARQKYLDREKRIEELQAKIEKGSAAQAKKSKVERANEIAKQHPDWTKEQVIKAVRAEFQ